MSHNDPDPNRLIRICPRCSYKNELFYGECSQCGQSLAGVKIQLESLLPTSLQVPPADETTTNIPGAKASIDQLLDKQQTISLSQLDGSGQDTHIVPIPANHSDKQQEHAPTPEPPLHQVYSGRRWILKRSRIVKAIMVIVASLAIAALLFALLPRFPGAGSNAIGLGEFKTQHGELLGVNDGSFPPFLGGNDGQLKQQAADQLKQGHSSQAISLWQAAIHIKNNDAEAWIYLENQRVMLSGLPYVTLVAGTDLLESSSSGLSDLQGVYVAQHEFNNENHGFRIRILIANSGTDINNMTPIAQQIVNIANQDKTVVGVISWLTSTENLTALPILSHAHIPMISPAASSDQLSGISPFFFRVVPANKVQGKAAALFAEHTLHARNVVVFVDNHDSYSQNLAQDFGNQFRKDGNKVLKEEPFTTNTTAKIGGLIQDALKSSPDLLYFTSPDTSDVANFQDALPTSGTFAQLSALCGDAGYVIHKAGYGRWYFASFAFPNVVDNLIGTTPPFYQDYSNDFNEDGLKLTGFYGYTRPDDITMLSYDVTSVFLQALQQAIIKNKIAVTSAGLQQVTPVLLANTLPDVTLQGVSGLITFDSNHDPVNKAIVFLAASADGHTHMNGWEGCFAPGKCQHDS